MSEFHLSRGDDVAFEALGWAGSVARMDSSARPADPSEADLFIRLHGFSFRIGKGIYVSGVKEMTDSCTALGRGKRHRESKSPILRDLVDMSPSRRLGSRATTG